MWNPGGSFSHKEADDFLRGFGDDLEAALATIEQRIVLFAKDPDKKPWTVAKFAKSYNGIGLRAERERDLRVGHVRAEDCHHDGPTGEVDL